MGDMADYYNDIGGWEGVTNFTPDITYYHTRLRGVGFLRETEKAYLVNWQELEFWLPKSILMDVEYEEGELGECLAHKATLFKILHAHLKEKYPLSPSLGGYNPILYSLVG